MKGNESITIIGAGRLGGALALALARKNHLVENLAVRNTAKAERIAALIEPKPAIITAKDYSKINSEIILITTQDSEIGTVAESLARAINYEPQVFHTSGSLSSEILHSLKQVGCQTGSIHPLVSISDAELGAERFTNAYFCVEGDKKAILTAGKIVKTLSGKSFSVATEYKALYHASAVTACGHLVAVVDAALEMLTACGLAEKDARQILLPLIQSTVENLTQQNASEALTGTFARADRETLDKHIKILRETVSPEALEIYLQLGARSLHLAERQGANRENLEKMRRQIMLAKTNLK
jgi:predicted short-subunit dehydrogenase-like oxidoreductase (DUF2520 family)